jgi:hypothetical protein
MGNLFSHCCFLSPNDNVDRREAQQGPREEATQTVVLSRSAKRRAKKKQNKTASETSPLLPNNESFESFSVQQTGPIDNFSPSATPDITAYIQYARREQSKYMMVKNFEFLADCWKVALQSLNSDIPQTPNTVDNGYYISLSNLRLIQRASEPDEIIKHLFLLAEPRAPRLVGITRYHLKSFRFSQYY